MTTTTAPHDRYGVLAALSALAEYEDDRGNVRAAELYRCAHDLTDCAGSPVILDADASARTMLADRVTDAAGECFRAATAIEYG